MALFDRETQLIQILESLARTGNISQTGSELSLSQPTVSKLIRTQEKAYGVDFVDRSTHPLKLTYAGEYYLNKIRGIAQAYQTLGNNLSTYAADKHGRISLGINPSLAQVILPQILPQYHLRYPQIEVQLRERDSLALQQNVQNGDLDLYIGVTPAYNEALAYQHLYSDSGALVLPERLFPQTLPTKPLVDISPLVNGKDFILETSESDFQRTVDGYLTKYNISPNVVLQTANLTTACILATAGLGATIIPLSMPAHYLHDAPVTTLPLSPSVFQTEVKIAYNRERQLSAPVQAFIEMAIAAFDDPSLA
ncbi:MAG: LysR family transcriptional regulator [Lactobacillus sp.]|jgi:DNA-binding transcriptional LysR family regulator|nr:LysR family transcriptional regulator [Lactobacillus sp.]MCI2031966.1 LysR family transcriptional regulator [Lactobacillus sp.]